MRRMLTVFGTCLLMACEPAPAPDAGAAAPPAEPPTESASITLPVTVEAAVDEAPAPFIPEAFEPPVRVDAGAFVIVPLGQELVDIDYEAYMSSIEHLQTTFTRSTSWPREGISDEEAMLDMETEAARFAARTSFAYAVLTPDGTRERGCVYVRPASKPGFDAEVKLWVTQAEFDAGFDPELYAWARAWVADTWPFESVAYPGRAIPWEDWDALPDA